MTERVDLREFVDGFIAEAEELLALANASLLEIESVLASGGTRPRAVRELFRALHTMKGLAGMIGIEPIVEVAHALETLVRTADRAGGVLRRAAVEASLLGVAAISERVRDVAAERKPAPIPPALLEMIAATDTATDEVVAAPPAITPEWDARLSSGERQQVATAVRAGTPVFTVTFVPAEDIAARGITIATVRQRLGALGEVVKVLPRAVTGTPGTSVVFDLLVVASATPAALAEAGVTTVEHVVPLVVAAPATPEETTLEPITDSPETIGRSVVRVELARLDELQDQLALLIVSRFRLEREIARAAEQGVDVRQLREVATLQGRQLRDLRRAILRARMVRVAEVLEPLALLVRSLTRGGHKEVRIELDARDAELDKTVADRLLPALVHLVRNAVDHAIEPIDERVAAGKPRHGTIVVSCHDVANRLEVTVRDDGRGIDREAIARRAGRSVETDDELLDVITSAGFSTRNVASRTSGRGLGMDIVRRIAVTELRGELAVSTTLGAGTTFTVRVPLTIAVVDVFSFECGSQSFVVPVASVEEIFELSPESVITPAARTGQATIKLHERRGQAIPVVSLGVMLALGNGDGEKKALVVRRNGEPVAFSVDRMIGRHEVVVRPIEDPLIDVPGIAGATDLGDGHPTLVLDLVELGVTSGVTA